MLPLSPPPDSAYLPKLHSTDNSDLLCPLSLQYLILHRTDEEKIKFLLSFSFLFSLFLFFFFSPHQFPMLIWQHLSWFSLSTVHTLIGAGRPSISLPWLIHCKVLIWDWDLAPAKQVNHRIAICCSYQICPGSCMPLSDIPINFFDLPLAFLTVMHLFC